MDINMNLNVDKIVFKARDIGKIRVGTWNLAHFMNAASTTSPHSTIDIAEGRIYGKMREKFRNHIDKANLDILVCVEYDDVFKASEPTTDPATDVFGSFPYRYISPRGTTGSGFQYNAIFSKYKLEGGRTIHVNGEEAGFVYPQYVFDYLTEAWIGDTCIVAFHDDDGHSGPGAAQIEEQIRYLKNRYQNVSKLIICGDTNVNVGAFENTAAFMQGIFPRSEGYEMLSTGYLNRIATMPSDADALRYSPVDNVITKGFSMANRTVVAESTSTGDVTRMTDHCLVYCDLVAL